MPLPIYLHRKIPPGGINNTAPLLDVQKHSDLNLFSGCRKKMPQDLKKTETWIYFFWNLQLIPDNN
jgi:hypothetical protein